MKKRSASGFTLLELMVGISIAALIVGLGVPGMRSFLRNNDMSSVANDYLTAIHTARAEAVKRQVRTALCFSSNPTTATPVCDGNGSQGWVVFVDTANPNVPAATDGNMVVDVGEVVLLRQSALPSTISIRNSRPTGNSGYLSFLPSGFTRTSTFGTPLTSFVLCDYRGNSAAMGPNNSAARGLQIATTGRPRVSRSVAEIASATFGGC